MSAEETGPSSGRRSNCLGFLNVIPQVISQPRIYEISWRRKRQFEEEGTKGGKFGRASVVLAYSDNEIIVFTSG